MQVNAAKTFTSLAQCDVPLNTNKESIVFYREQEGGKSFLVAKRKKDLSILQRIKRFFGSSDFSFETANRIVEIALPELGVLPSSFDQNMIQNVKGWYRYISMRASPLWKNTPRMRPCPEIEEKIKKRLNLLFPNQLSCCHFSSTQYFPNITHSSASSPNSSFHKQLGPPPHVPESPLFQQVQLEILSFRPLSHPRDPIKVHGIVNQKNWCFLDSFIQAAFASSRFKEELEKRVQDSIAFLLQLDKEIEELKDQKQKLLTRLSIPENEIKKLALEIISLEDKNTHNRSLLEHAEIEKKLRELLLPAETSIEDLKKAYHLFMALALKEEKRSAMPAAKSRAEALLALFKDLPFSSETVSFSPLKKGSAINTFVTSFEKTKSFFYSSLASHTQQDPTELLNALCIDDLLVKQLPICQETNIRQNRSARADLSPISISAIDKQKVYFDTIIPIPPPDPLPNTLSLPQMFQGVLDTYSLEKDKNRIAEQEENKALFDGDEGVLRKSAFLSTIHDDLLVMRSLSLITPPACLILSISRFDNTRNKRAFTMKTPFRLEVPLVDKKSCAIYLLRSVVIHKGLSLSTGHYYSYVSDLRSIDPSTATPTRFACLNDASVYFVDAKTAMDQIENNGYILFYDKITPP